MTDAITKQHPRRTWVCREIITKPSRIVLIVSLLFGVVYFIVQPSLLVQPDEPAHWLRAYNLSTGHPFCDWAPEPGECTYPRAIYDRTQEVSLEPYPGMTHAWDSIDPSDSVDVGGTLTGTATYSPLMYLPQVIGMWLGGLFGSAGSIMLGGRLINYLVYAIGLWFLVSKIRYGKWALAAIGLLPTPMVLAASLSPDGVCNLVVLAAIVFVVNLFASSTPMGWGQRITFFALCGAIALTKTNSVTVLLPLAFLSASKWSRGFKPPWKKQTIKWVTGAIGIVIVVSGFVVWRIISSPLVDHTVYPAPLFQDGPLWKRAGHIAQVFFNTYLGIVSSYSDLMLRGVFGTFASFRFHLPLIFVFMELIVILLAMLWSASERQSLDVDVTKRMVPAGLWGGALAGGVFNIVAVTYLMYTAWAILPWRLGPGALWADGVQGRYFSAFAALLIPVVYRLRSKIRVIISPAVVGTMVTVASLVSLLYAAFQTWSWFDFSGYR